ncbi:Protein-synthesizing GTPase protein [Dioscorea alata]|uniref:Protein-synthesizing GTPase protein n=1 Tax=Dioscorea alata TaxID=55571 RepID=A0ACB7TTY7_DIOAL|nr:Protein-synthesizing GTPase protein [Dioscorea alata]
MGRKKAVAIDDDEYSFPDDPSEKASEGPEKENRGVAGKKNKKGGGGGGKAQRNKVVEDEEVDEIEKEKEDDDDEPINVVFSGKKKSSKSKKGGGSSSSASAFSSFNLIAEDEGNDEVEETRVVSRFDIGNHVEDEGDEIRDPDGEVDTFGGGEDGASKKKKKKKQKGGRSAQEEEDLDKLLAELGEGPAPSDPTPAPVPAPIVDDGDESKDQLGGGVEEAGSKKQQKKKKKKGGRTAQEEEDLDKLLAELGEGPAPTPQPLAPSVVAVEESVSAPPEQGEVEAEEKDQEADGVGTAASKKKKKKKKDDKKAAPAVAEAKEEKEEEVKWKGPAKKLPKHVREMQEALARRKEAEERQKREEEERLRKEEEERKRLEEEERLKEEAKRRKKEKEKELREKKRQEGKLLTGKQKEERRRLEAMRNQFLAQRDVPLGEVVGETKKRPKYETKKSKANQAKALVTGKVEENQKEASEPDVELAEDDSVIEEEIQSQVEEPEDIVEDKLVAEVGEAMEEEQEEEEDEDEWDAKSLDDLVVKLPATSPFAEEDKEDEEDAPVTTKKSLERVASISSATNDSQAKNSAPAKPAVKKVVASRAPSKNEDVDGIEVDRATERTMQVKGKKEPASSEKKSGNDLRSPICCILGHVDTGKTKLLDCIRRTNVQEGEAGGITQQIGATYFPTEYIRERTKELKADATLKVPGLLVIDTPGHESFTNLRSRGSSLCDIAILVVDIMHGLEQQTIESLNLLKSRNTEFIVALNKVDRLYGWKATPNAPIIKSIKQQSKDVQNEFNMRLTQIVTQLKEQGLNTALYYKNKDMGETFNIVPTSAISGEGIPDLLLLLVQWSQKTMAERLTYVDEVQCTVLEVKVIEGLGTTIDVVLVNGVLHEGDQIVVCGMQGPIVTNIRTLLTPAPMKELRVKGQYIHHKELKAAQGVKIAAQGLEHAIAGTALYVVGPNDDVEDVKESVMQDMRKVMSRIDKSGEGVFVQASTLGSLEALTEFLRSPAVNIPFSDFSIGPVHKKDVMKASVMLERKKEFATILAFDVKVMPDARELAEESGVKIFVADIIYHLFDQFKAYIDNLREEKKKESAEEAVFPCVLKIMRDCIFNKKDPIILGVDVLEGILKVGTPICVPSRDFIDIGKIASIEINHKQVDVATKGQKVAVKIVSNSPEEQQKMFGRHFEIDDELVSHISRRSIDILKADYRDDLSMEEWKLVVRLKQIFKIP